MFTILRQLSRVFVPHPSIVLWERGRAGRCTVWTIPAVLAVVFSVGCAGSASTKSSPGSAKKADGRGKTSDGYYHVIATGETTRDATREARKLIVEDGLGAYIESHSVSVDAQLKEKIIKASSSGFVYDFSIVETITTTPAVKIHAKGKVSEKAVAQAIKYRYAEIGKPRLLIVFEETIAGQKSAPGRTISSAKLTERFSDFQFVDGSVSQRLEAAGGGFSNGEAASGALSEARRADADFLFLGRTEVEQGPPIEGTQMFRIKAHVDFRMVSVATGVVLAEVSESFTVPFLNTRQGGIIAIERVVDSVHPKFIEQIGSKWEPGQTIRVVFEGIDYDRFADLDVVGALRKWERVGSVQDRGRDEAGHVVLEVEALMSGSDFYRLLRANRAQLKLDFSSLEVKSNRIRVKVTKAGE